MSLRKAEVIQDSVHGYGCLKEGPYTSRRGYSGPVKLPNWKHLSFFKSDILWKIYPAQIPPTWVCFTRYSAPSTQHSALQGNGTEKHTNATVL